MTGNGSAGKPAVGAGVKSFVFLVLFALLGAYTGMQVILGFRSIFSGSLLIMGARFFWFALGVWATWSCFRKFRAVRESAGRPVSGLLLFLAWTVFTGGCVGYRLSYRTPGAKLEDEMAEERLACASHVASVLSVSGPADSHEPGSGYIVLKATFTARTRLVLHGGGWLPGVSDSDAVFYAELPRTELEPGKPTALTFYLLVNPEHDNAGELRSDGPYFIPEITAYVQDPARTEHWATWAGDVSCKAPVIRNFTTKPYKAAQMGRLKWSFEEDYPFMPPNPKKAGKTAKK